MVIPLLLDLYPYIPVEQGIENGIKRPQIFGIYFYLLAGIQGEHTFITECQI